jgi:hypothetical protein
MPNQLSAVRFKPLRLTFAQVCIWCETRWCDSPECVARYDQSRWMICPECEGRLSSTESLQPCRCYYGVVEAPLENLPRLPALVVSA